MFMPALNATANANENSNVNANANANAFAGLLLCALIALSYFPAVFGGLVWDDGIWAETPAIRSLAGLWDIWFAPGAIHNEAHYWPVLYSLFYLEHALWGLAPLGYHLVNLLLHAAVTLLLWRLLRRLEVPGSWFIAALFAVHPMHVEAVAWVIGRKDILATLCYLAAMFAYLNFMQQRRRWQYAAVMAWFVVGMLSKSIAVTLPATLLLWHWWKQGRVTGADGMRVLPLLVVGLGIAFGDVVLTRLTETIVSTYSLFDRMIIAARALCFYVGKLLLPINLAVIYPRWGVDAAAPQHWVYVAAVGAALVGLWSLRHRFGRGPLAAALFFIIALSPTLGWVDYGYMRFAYVADRFQYLGGIGVFALTVAALSRGAQHWRHHRWMPHAAWQAAAGALVLAVLVTLSWRQAGIYQNETAFFSHIVAHNPSALSVHYNLGNAYRQQGRLDEALAMYRIALQKRPRYAKLHTNLGLTLMQRQQLDAAEQHLQFVVQLQPREPNGMLNLAALRAKQKRYSESIALYQDALALAPEFGVAHDGLRLVLQQQAAAGEESAK